MITSEKIIFKTQKQFIVFDILIANLDRLYITIIENGYLCI